MAKSKNVTEKFDQSHFNLLDGYSDRGFMLDREDAMEVRNIEFVVAKLDKLGLCREADTIVHVLRSALTDHKYINDIVKTLKGREEHES